MCLQVVLRAAGVLPVLCNTMQVLVRLSTSNTRTPTHISVNWKSCDDELRSDGRAGAIQGERQEQDAAEFGIQSQLIPTAPDAEDSVPVAEEVRRLPGSMLLPCT